MPLVEIADLTPATATEILLGAGALQRGNVSDITLGSALHAGFVSHTAVVQLGYSSDAEGERPRRLFLKVTRPDLHPEYRLAGFHEVEFYTKLLPLQPALPAARCYHAAWDAATSHAALLLEDLSEHYAQRPMPIPPSPRHCELIIDSLAQLHAAWWNHPELGRSIGAPLSAADAEASLRRLEASVPAFMDSLGASMLPKQREAYERILASPFLKHRAERLQEQRNVTLIHGDAHTNNVMLPVQPDDPRAVLIDWQRWTIDIPLFDLAFLMALHWSAERRAALEQPLLLRYHTRLVEHGVPGYSWEACWDDYRACVIVMVLIPIGQARRRMPAGVVWYGMEQSVAAFHNLGCGELL
jgi:Ser/Thr protein kinase RdoA (MazF antagonist)